MRGKGRKRRRNVKDNGGTSTAKKPNQKASTSSDFLNEANAGKRTQDFNAHFANNDDDDDSLGSSEKDQPPPVSETEY